jgi:hypothetical protein
VVDPPRSVIASFSYLRPSTLAMNALPSLSFRSVSTPAFFHCARMDWTRSENPGPQLAVLSTGIRKPAPCPAWARRRLASARSGSYRLRPSGGSWSMGMDHSRSAAGTAGFGEPWPKPIGLVSITRLPSTAKCSARRTLRSRRGSSSSRGTPKVEINQVNSTIGRLGLRRWMVSRSVRWNVIWISGAKS